MRRCLCSPLDCVLLELSQLWALGCVAVCGYVGSFLFVTVCETVELSPRPFINLIRMINSQTINFIVDPFFITKHKWRRLTNFYRYQVVVLVTNYPL